MQNVRGDLIEGPLGRIVRPVVVLGWMQAPFPQVEILKEGTHTLRARKTDIR